MLVPEVQRARWHGNRPPAPARARSATGAGSAAERCGCCGCKTNEDRFVRPDRRIRVVSSALPATRAWRRLVIAPARPRSRRSRRPLPRHVAIIMDGNRRWAKRRGLPAIEGHRRGIVALRHVRARRATWDRSAHRLRFLDRELESRRAARSRCCSICASISRATSWPNCARNNVRVRVIGDWESLPPAPRKALAGLAARDRAQRRIARSTWR